MRIFGLCKTETTAEAANAVRNAVMGLVDEKTQAWMKHRASIGEQFGTARSYIEDDVNVAFPTMDHSDIKLVVTEVSFSEIDADYDVVLFYGDFGIKDEFSWRRMMRNAAAIELNDIMKKGEITTDQLMALICVGADIPAYPGWFTVDNMPLYYMAFECPTSYVSRIIDFCKESMQKVIKETLQEINNVDA